MSSEVPSTPRFFVLEPGFRGSNYDGDVESAMPLNLGRVERCAACGAAVGKRPWLPPYRVNLILHGEQPGDFLATAGHDFLVSERFVQAFQAEGLTGLEGLLPVEVLRVRRRQRGLSAASAAPSYRVVRARYGPAAVDLGHSGLRYAEPLTCDVCRSMNMQSVHGFQVEAGSWKGEDLCRLRGLTGVLTVSERFERFVARHGFTNMRLTRTENYVWDPLTPKLGS